MKKIIFMLCLFVASMAAQAQFQRVTVADGSRTGDSLKSGVYTWYFYLNGSKGTQNGVALVSGTKATLPLSNYEIFAIEAGTLHSTITGTGDSTFITLEVSLDNTIWIQWNLTPTITQSGTSKFTIATYTFATLALGCYGIYVPTLTTGKWPYMRVKMVGSGTGVKYPKVFVTLAKCGQVF